jgi:hypothetical protein
MSLEDTRVTQDVRSTSQLNGFLEKGWVLIMTYVDDVGEIGAPSGRPHFVVSWQEQRAPHTRRLQRWGRHPKIVLAKAQE